ncbi:MULTISPECIES: acetyl-CoA decarbonylase/synthase complex subunit delta [Paraclostridium]|uniref:Acetyl-CoA decarbonylase/synthase complex subunit delta n=1 Tax=Paraclostridium bifermentans TaxID=1490 RepID=A0A5P3XHE2_PARBF|nr:MULTISPECIES: acetyl-CoA decarbonylase/synthase complex subunit delta [Paraclostridium]KGJ49239.1 acetyl-CoA synthase subunit delta [Clostridium sp. NCR]MCU9806885.1 acetyl-CoA decarbonylase/synthase complex subunit delta [Paraclostridium sp. AKS46]MDV8112588.1 acetyl-CoA decarbonylase/synthase complex subunit delta [Bacillus sp. BAU-SS-2023]MBN8048624.1 acetyl-CoA decarbonylase/synthase complex subunit delta [Paraclostridium bifermentans]MBZ6005839.1 acetyl-CoA decarbonylase/synthase compl
MAFKMSVQKYSGKISEVEIGSGERAIKIGGENILPFYNFDGDQANTQKIGVEMLDVYPENWTSEIKNLYEDVANDSVKWAKYIEEKIEPDFICLRLEGADPNGLDKTPEECAEVAKKVLENVSLPIVIAGCGNHEKDAKVFEKVAQAVDGYNCLFMSATEENYKGVGAAAGMAYGHKVGAESSVDINLAKQLNVLLTQLGVKQENIVMNVGCSAAGYGYEYVASTMDRIRLAALGQNDKTLQMPIITPVCFESWNVKESVASIEDEPAWGCPEARGISMEISTASSALAGGSNAVVLRHPKSVETIKTLISELA